MRVKLNFISDIIQTNKSIVIKSSKLAINNWKIFLVGIAYSILSFVVWTIASYAWILGGIIAAIGQSAIISNYLYLIENIINYDKFSLEDFKRGFQVYLWRIYSIFIIFFIVNLGMSLFLDPILYSIGILGVSLRLIINIAALIMLNTIPEVIYQKHYDRLDIIRYSFEFIKDNWLEWFLPNVFIAAIAYLVHIMTSRALISVGLYYNPVVSTVVRAIIYQLILAYAMIYRGQLFNILSTSTRRKRMFMRNMYK